MRRKGKATDADAKACVFVAWQRYKTDSFRTSPQSPMWPALIRARELGYIWFPEPTKASITVDGIRSLKDYGVPQA